MIREFWTPTRPLFGRKRISAYSEFYDLYPGDLLTYEDGEWVKEGPGLYIMGVQVDVFRDNLQAVRVQWIEVTEQYIFLDSVVTDESLKERGKPPTTLADLGLRPTIPVPVWPPPPPPEPPEPKRPYRGPWG